MLTIENNHIRFSFPDAFWDSAHAPSTIGHDKYEKNVKFIVNHFNWFNFTQKMVSTKLDSLGYIWSIQHFSSSTEAEFWRNSSYWWLSPFIEVWFHVYVCWSLAPVGTYNQQEFQLTALPYWEAVSRQCVF